MHLAESWSLAHKRMSNEADMCLLEQSRGAEVVLLVPQLYALREAAAGHIVADVPLQPCHEQPLVNYLTICLQKYHSNCNGAVISWIQTSCKCAEAVLLVPQLYALREAAAGHIVAEGSLQPCHQQPLCIR